jgi:hypothetical protein
VPQRAAATPWWAGFAFRLALKAVQMQPPPGKTQKL